MSLTIFNNKHIAIGKNADFSNHMVLVEPNTLSLLGFMLDNDIEALLQKHGDYADYISRIKTSIIQGLSLEYDRRKLQQDFCVSKREEYLTLAKDCNEAAITLSQKKEYLIEELGSLVLQHEAATQNKVLQIKRLDALNRKIETISAAQTAIEDYPCLLLENTQASKYDYQLKKTATNMVAMKDEFSRWIEQIEKEEVFAETRADYLELEKNYLHSIPDQKIKSFLKIIIDIIEHMPDIEVDVNQFREQISKFSSPLWDSKKAQKKLDQLVLSRIFPEGKILGSVIINPHGLYNRLTGDKNIRAAKMMQKTYEMIAPLLRQNNHAQSMGPAAWNQTEPETANLLNRAAAKDNDLARRIATYYMIRKTADELKETIYDISMTIKKARKKDKNVRIYSASLNAGCQLSPTEVTDWFEQIKTWVVKGLSTYADIIFKNATAQYNEDIKPETIELAEIKQLLIEERDAIEDILQEHKTRADRIESIKAEIVSIDARIKKAAEEEKQQLHNAKGQDDEAAEIDIEQSLLSKYDDMIKRYQSKLISHIRNVSNPEDDDLLEETQPKKIYTDIISLEDWKQISANTLYTVCNNRAIQTWFMFNNDALNLVPEDIKIRSRMLSAIQKGLSGDESGIKNIGTNNRLKQGMYEIKIKNSGFRLTGNEHQVGDKRIIIFDRAESHK